MRSENVPLKDEEIALIHKQLHMSLIATIWMLVISSMAKRTPSRPIPLWRLPPYGMWSARKDGVTSRHLSRLTLRRYDIDDRGLHPEA